jgi:hypothetical protein
MRLAPNCLALSSYHKRVHENVKNERFFGLTNGNVLIINAFKLNKIVHVVSV